MHRRPAVLGANCVWSWLLRVCSRWRQRRRRGHSRHGASGSDGNSGTGGTSGDGAHG